MVRKIEKRTYMRENRNGEEKLIGMKGKEESGEGNGIEEERRME